MSRTSATSASTLSAQCRAVLADVPSATKARTPKWAIRYGLVDTSDIDRRAKKSQWAKRYDERLPESTLVGQQLADGEEGPDYTPHDERNDERLRNEGLWTRDDDVEYYNEDEAPNQRKWHYPANFEGTVGDGRSKRRQKDTGGDRWERTRQARSSVDSGSAGAGAGSGSGSGSYGTYPPRAATDDDVPEWGRDYGSKGRRSSKSNKKGNASTAYNNNSSSHNNGSAYTDDSSSYSGNNSQAAAAKKPSSPDDVFSHEF